MKIAILPFVFLALVSVANADEAAGYQTSLAQLKERLQTLETEREDYRKATPDNVRPKLPPAQQAERYRLLGELFSEAPLWALSQQLQADIEALADPLKPQIPEENRAVLEESKDFLAISASLEGSVKTRAQATAFAVTLRQFIVRRDVSGAQVWARAGK